MDLKDNNKAGLKRLIRSFSYAIQGFIHAVRKEKNMQIHLVCALLVIFFSFLFSISALEFLLILFLIGMVISLELINTALERVVDLVTEEYHPLAKQAKDVAAAAVLTMAIIAAVAAIFIFYEPALVLLQKMFFR